MSKIYLLNYNNYYNRIVKTTTLSSYKSQAIYSADKIDFKPNDSCYTDQILNFSEAINPDYLIVTDVVGGTETLTSRWFILESRRLRGGQYNLRLRRDVFADYKSIVKDATIYCEKGYVSDTDPLIFSSEGNTYNQIKTEEVLLKDSTNSAWIVGYCDSKMMDDGPITVNINTTAPAYNVSAASNAQLLTDFPTSSFSTPPDTIGNLSNIRFSFSTYEYQDNPQWPGYYNITISPERSSAAQTSHEPNLVAKNMNALMAYLPLTCPEADQLYSDLMGDLSTDNEHYQMMLENQGIIARVGTYPDYRYYQLQVKLTGVDTSTSRNSGNLTYDIWDDLWTMIHSAEVQGLWDTSPAVFPDDSKVHYYATLYKAQWIDITQQATATIAQTIPISKKAPYYMFVMPYLNADYYDGGLHTANGSYSIPFVQSLIKSVGTHVIDVQLLPYFPDQYNLNAGIVQIDEMDPNAITWLKDGDNNDLSFIYWGAPNSFTVSLTQKISALEEVKIDNETRFCRLNAPNFSASCDFSIAKNRGVKGFVATCTYRPYQPHIQVAPRWDGIYGQYFADGRGLICGGDYSMDIVNDAWTEYQINNKNYQLMFDRQIQTMDLQHDVQRINEKFSVGAGILSATASGAMAGASGGIPGMIAGGLAGGLTSAAGGLLDIRNNERLRADQRSAAFDMFNYNLGNVQARPTTITKMAALVGNNKIWPFYEIYSATSREVAVLNLQLQYSGMTVGAIGTVKQYIGPSQTFIRGRLIRITGLEHDAEMSQLVADELARGIYIT